MDLLIAIVNYRTAELVAACLRSLEREVHAAGRARVVVVDNASQDGSAEAIARTIEECGYSSWAELLALPNNGGFACGNNAAIAPALRAPDPPEFDGAAERAGFRPAGGQYFTCARSQS